MDDRHDRPPGTGEQLSSVKMPVSDGEVDEAEEGVEGGSEKGQEVAHAGNDLGKDEGDGPDDNHEEDPDGPAEDGVAVGVLRSPHDAGVEEFGGDVGVDDANDDGGNDDEGEGSLLIGDHAQTAKGRCGRVLTEIPEPDGGGHDEQESGDSSQDCEGLGEVLGPLHLGDESREQNLGDPEEGDVQDGVHAIDPGGSRKGERVGPDQPVGGIIAVVSNKRGGLDTGEDEEEEDGNSHAGSCDNKWGNFSKDVQQDNYQLGLEGKGDGKQEHRPENMDMKETWSRVLGIDITMPMSMAMMEKTTVHREWSESVLRTLAPVRM